MKLATVQLHGRTTWGVVHDQSFADVGAVLHRQFTDLHAVIAANALTEVAAAIPGAQQVPLTDVIWLPVIPNPGKIFCVGLNYEMHRQETGRAEVENPTIFARFANSQIGHLANLVRPRQSTQLDYEGELALIIGRAGRHIPRAAAMAHVAGYACYNEGSVRDFQRHTSQYTPGKNFPGTGAFGPWMVTADEMGPIGPQRLQTRLNGAIVQDALLSQMIFDIPRQIEYCSSFTRLEPGDVIVTGTPGGVGSRRDPPIWLKPGDTVEVEIDGLGVLRNGVALEMEQVSA